ncbi:unnamed protein product [Clonostachys solani]|uniref:Alpha/beta hydrolase fold-3 domain-containing protein n=1 Tax=Clonostachys solani TaxID=160281 RepID=A0A9N9W8X8_9HYPO|nr:unnamed protein product [Clonostachys solani]
MAPTVPSLSLAENLDLVFRLLVVAPAYGLAKFTIGIPKALRRGIPLSLLGISTVCYTFLACLSPRQIQTVAPNSQRAYASWIKSKVKAQRKPGASPQLRRLKHDIEELEETGGSIMWVGDRATASKFVLFFHGGGYVMCASDGQLEWCWNAYVCGGPGEKHNVAVGVMEYTLCPVATYPQQLRQCCAALRALLERGIRPSDIMIGGDSAGGSLTVQLLRHIVDPHPCVEPLGNWLNDEPLAAAFIVSAPVSGRTDTVSYRENTLDMLSGPLINFLTEIFLVPENVTPPLTMEEIRGLAFPLESDLSWLGRVHKAARAMYLTAGDEEVFRDHICEFVEALQARSKSVDVRFDLFSKHVHDSHLIEGFFGTGPAITAMAAWAEDIF